MRQLAVYRSVSMRSTDAQRVRTLYGIDWTDVDARARGLAAAAEVMSPDVKARISPEVGERVLDGIDGFATFIEGLEEDFSEFQYDVEVAEETAPGRVTLGGVVHARGRRSRMPPASDRTEVVDDRDDVIEPGQLERAANGVRRPDEDDSAARLDRASVRGGDHSHAARIHETDPAEVDHEQGGRTFLDLRKLGDDALSDLEIEVAANGDDRPAAFETRFNLEVQHGAS